MTLSRTLLFMLLLLSTMLQAQDNTVNYIRITDAHIRELPPSVRNTAVYMTISNSSERNMRLTGVSSEAAESAMLHRSAMEDGMMTMQHVMTIEIPAGESLVLEPGALHIMLTGLKRNLRDGDSVSLRLEFDDAPDVSVNVQVRKL
tara:strand:- start:1849 stop:2286 length:438 start_codon:yes stop_codon:yes gene_type:complete